MDAWRAPERVRGPHLANQRPKVCGQRRSTDATGSRIPPPIGGERAPMPTHHRGGRDDLHGPPPVWPDGREQHPEQPIDRTEPRSFPCGALQHRKLMPEGENLGPELKPRAGRGPERGHLPKPCAHGRRRHRDADSFELSDDLLISPARVFSREPQDQLSNFGTNRRPAVRRDGVHRLATKRRCQQRGRRDDERAPA